MKDLFSYEGKRVLVGGCASGIGAATAQGALELGATVVGLDVVEPTVALDDFVAADLGDYAAVRRALTALDNPFDAVFLCSGISDGKGLGGEQVITINFIGTRELLDGLSPNMAPGAAIGLIASLAAVDVAERWDEVGDFLAQPTWEAAVQWCRSHEHLLAPGEAYPFSKLAITGYVLRNAAPLARRGIRINCISPSPVLTPFLNDTKRMPGAEEALARFPIPLGRHSEPEEQAAVLLFLGSAAASFVTGQNVWTDGGYTAAVTAGDAAPVVGRQASKAS